MPSNCTWKKYQVHPNSVRSCNSYDDPERLFSFDEIGKSGGGFEA